jgi:hypothetical protein
VTKPKNPKPEPVDDYVKRIVAAAPQLTDEQRTLLRLIFADTLKPKAAPKRRNRRGAA